MHSLQNLRIGSKSCKIRQELCSWVLPESWVPLSCTHLQPLSEDDHRDHAVKERAKRMDDAIKQKPNRNEAFVDPTRCLLKPVQLQYLLHRS